MKMAKLLFFLKKKKSELYISPNSKQEREISRFRNEMGRAMSLRARQQGTGHRPPSQAWSSRQDQVGAQAPESCGLRGHRVRGRGLGQPRAPPLPPLSKWPPPCCSSWALSIGLATGQRSERCVLSRSSSSPGLGPQQTPLEAPEETVTLKNCLGRRWGPKPRAKKQTVGLGGTMLRSPARQLGLLRGFSTPEPA